MPDVNQVHGLRKFLLTTLTEAEVDPQYQKMILVHLGLDESYLKPTQNQVLQQYVKAIDSITIDNQHCLQRKVIELTEKQSDIELMKLEQRKKDKLLEDLERRLEQQEAQRGEQLKMQEVPQKLLESIIERTKLTEKMEQDVYDKSSAFYTDERFKKLNMTQEQHLPALERLRLETNEAIQNTLLPKIANIAKGLQDNDIAAAKAAAKRIVESKDFNEKFF